MNNLVGTFWKGSARYESGTQYFIVHVRGINTITGNTQMAAIHNVSKNSITQYEIPEFSAQNEFYNWQPATQEEWSLSVMRGYYQPSDTGS